MQPATVPSFYTMTLLLVDCHPILLKYEYASLTSVPVLVKDRWTPGLDCVGRPPKQM